MFKEFFVFTFFTAALVQLNQAGEGGEEDGVLKVSVKHGLQQIASPTFEKPDWTHVELLKKIQGIWNSHLDSDNGKTGKNPDKPKITSIVVYDQNDDTKRVSVLDTNDPHKDTITLTNDSQIIIMTGDRHAKALGTAGNHLITPPKKA